MQQVAKVQQKIDYTLCGLGGATVSFPIHETVISLRIVSM
jgi:hypothetical protein